MNRTPVKVYRSTLHNPPKSERSYPARTIFTPHSKDLDHQPCHELSPASEGAFTNCAAIEWSQAHRL